MYILFMLRVDVGWVAVLRCFLVIDFGIQFFIFSYIGEKGSMEDFKGYVMVRFRISVLFVFFLCWLCLVIWFY